MKVQPIILERIDENKIKFILNKLRKENNNFDLYCFIYNIKNGFITIEDKINSTKLYIKHNQCENCRKTDNDTIIHHFIPTNIRPDLMFDTNNMIEICRTCHTKEHNELFIFYYEEYKKLNEITSFSIEEMENQSLEKRGVLQLK